MCDKLKYKDIGVEFHKITPHSNYLKTNIL